MPRSQELQNGMPLLRPHRTSANAGVGGCKVRARAMVALRGVTSDRTSGPSCTKASVTGRDRPGADVPAKRGGRSRYVTCPCGSGARRLG